MSTLEWEKIEEQTQLPAAAVGLAAVPERWIRLGTTLCNAWDGSRSATARIARTPHTLELQIDLRPPLHLLLTDVGRGRVDLSLPPTTSRRSRMRRCGDLVRVERENDGSEICLSDLGRGRLQLNLNVAPRVPSKLTLTF